MSKLTKRAAWGLSLSILGSIITFLCTESKEQSFWALLLMLIVSVILILIQESEDNHPTSAKSRAKFFKAIKNKQNKQTKDE